MRGKLFEEQTQTLYQLEKDLGLSKKRLYRYANGEIPITDMPVRLVLDLANYFKIEPNKLVDKMIRYQALRKVNKDV